LAGSQQSITKNYAQFRGLCEQEGRGLKGRVVCHNPNCAWFLAISPAGCGLWRAGRGVTLCRNKQTRKAAKKKEVMRILILAKKKEVMRILILAKKKEGDITHPLTSLC